MNTEAAFLQSIEANLADATPLLVFADWLEEQGADELAHAWRWMARRGYRPGKRMRRLARIPWGWWHGTSHEMESHPEDLADLGGCCGRRRAGLPRVGRPDRRAERVVLH
jgi:uncharacterized protein (TIGR02996 family)